MRSKATSKPLKLSFVVLMLETMFCSELQELLRQTAASTLPVSSRVAAMQTFSRGLHFTRTHSGSSSSTAIETAVACLLQPAVQFLNSRLGLPNPPPCY